MEWYEEFSKSGTQDCVRKVTAVKYTDCIFVDRKDTPQQMSWI